MSLVESLLAISAFIGATLTIVFYYRTAGTALEVRLNQVVKEKKLIIIKSYETFLEKIFNSYKYEMSLNAEHKEQLEKIAEISHRLGDLSLDLSEAVDKLTHSFLFGIVTVAVIIFLAYLLSANIDSVTLAWTSVIAIFVLAVSGYRYLNDGIWEIRELRKFEKGINGVDRSETLKDLEMELNELDDNLGWS